MKNKRLAILTAALWVALISGTSAFAQDFQKSYSLSPDGVIRIRTISGDISIQGYDGNKVVVEGFKVGRTPEKVEVLDRSAENKVDIDVKHEPNSNCDVNFRVRVPRKVAYNYSTIRSVSGDVRISDVSGHMVAESISGSVYVSNVNGIVSVMGTSGNVAVNNIVGVATATSLSGNVDVVLNRVEGAGDMKFTSVSGNVSITAPIDLDASVSISTVTGSLKTDFPIEIQQRRYVPGSSARGRLGQGTNSIVIRSVSGHVSLLKLQR